MEGVIVIDKPSGVTSHDVVSRVKRALGAKKVGHLGTLDPLATGALPLVVNGATKFAEKLQKGDKEYEAEMMLGVETDTLDAEGKVLATRPVDGITRDNIEAALKSFLGDIEQAPPMYSAVKQNGTPLYKLARKGITVEREPKAITISSIELISIELPLVRFRVVCSRGTYVRTLASDIGGKLGTGAHLTGLRRTRSGLFSLEGSVAMDSTPEALNSALLPLASLLGTAAGGKNTHNVNNAISL